MLIVTMDLFLRSVIFFFNCQSRKVIVTEAKYCYEYDLTKKSTLNSTTVFVRTNFYVFFMSYL